MPHAPYCTRDTKPTLWQRIRYGVLAEDVVQKTNRCPQCRRKEITVTVSPSFDVAIGGIDTRTMFDGRPRI